MKYRARFSLLASGTVLLFGLATIADARSETLDPHNSLASLSRPKQQQFSTPFESNRQYADRCGATQYYCNNPTPVCCWSQSRGYYCAASLSQC